MKYSHGLSCVLFIAACATSNDDTDNIMDLQPSNPDPADLQTSNPEPTTVAGSGQTNQAASGELAIPEPTLTTGGSSTATVTTSLAGAGLRIDGGMEAASYALASYIINTGAMRATAKLTVNPARGASFTYALRGTGGGYSSRYLRIQRVPGSDALQGVSTNGSVTCGALPSGQPTPVTLSFDGATQTFDVLIAGAATPCTHLPTRMAGPVTGFKMVDEAIDGYGGHVEFTNLALSASP
ncbi:MAG TPA: hypothetical protein VFK02_36805 [Kofleriaceae bacterium]|nr:hypothetical protein [Kofleriaceae bacterium]